MRFTMTFSKFFLTLILWAPAGLWAQTRVPTAAEQINELVTANRILANEGVLDAYGHVSIRDERNPNHFFLGKHTAAGLITAEDIIEYDLDSKPVDPKQTEGYTERFIHGEIYRARPDVKAVVHTHAPDLIPFTVTATPLRPISHMAAFLGEGVSKFEIRDAAGASDMLIRSPELGKALAKALAGNPAALMRGHGAVVVAPSLHVAVGRAYYMNFNARLLTQALLLGGGKVVYIDKEEAAKAGNQDGFERGWAYWKARVGR